MLGKCPLQGNDVVELAPGLGRTAKEIVNASPKSYTGIDQDADAVRRVAAVVGSNGKCIQANASETGLESGCADVVIGEAMLTMQSPRGKAAIIAEAARVLRPGGRYAIHELGLGPGHIDDETATEVSRALAKAIHVNARPLPIAQWRALLEEHGLEIEWSNTAPFALLKLGRNISDEGLLSVAKMAWRLLTQRDLRRRVLEMRKTFVEYENHMCGVAIVARKPLASKEEE